jgi:hypothetical protein
VEGDFRELRHEGILPSPPEPCLGQMGQVPKFL